MQHLNIHVHGRVQGVFFRQTAKQEADRLDIRGFARNEPDGTVYIEAEGEKDALEAFRDWCGSGSDIAQVNHVESEEADYKNYEDFSIH